MTRSERILDKHMKSLPKRTKQLPSNNEMVRNYSIDGVTYRAYVSALTKELVVTKTKLVTINLNEKPKVPTFFATGLPMM